MRMAISHRLDTSVARTDAGRRCGLDRRRNRRRSADRFSRGRIPALEPYRQPVLARGRVRYVGEPVAAVFAHDPYGAEDAADLVTMEIEELPCLLAADAAPGEFSSDATPRSRSSARATATWTRPCVLRPSSSSSSLPSGATPGSRSKRAGGIGRYDASRGILELHGAAGAHRNRELLARMLDRPPSSIHVHESHVGGGSAFAASFIPRTSSSVSLPCASAGP